MYTKPKNMVMKNVQFRKKMKMTMTMKIIIKFKMKKKKIMYIKDCLEILINKNQNTKP